MAENIKIKIDTSQYMLPSQEDINSGKQFVLRREENARFLEAKVDDCLANAAQEIVTICYKHNIDPKKFSISSQYNEQMMEEIAEVMDDVEQEILDYIYEYSTRVTTDRKKIDLLAAWMATLGRGNRNLQDTLDGYLYKAMKDWEAAIAALRYADVTMADAVTKIKSHLHSIYNMPEVRATFDNSDEFNATYIRSRGVMQSGVGISNNGSTNVTNMAKLTLQMAWMKEQGIEFDESGAAGYYQLRGSSYPCSICDDEVGFHIGLEDLYTKPYPHPHCCCYRIPIFALNQNEEKEDGNESKESDNSIITPEFKQRRREIKKLASALTKEVFTNKDVTWSATLSGAGIDEWLNQPHKHIAEKNDVLLNLKSLFANSDYIKPVKDPKNRQDVVQSHIFRTMIAGESSWIIVHEMTWGEYKIHSIADNNPIK